MQLSETTFQGALRVSGYGPGFFRIGEQVMRGPILLCGAKSLPWEGLHEVGPLVALASEVDVLFIGMGNEMTVLSDELRLTLEEAGIGIEPMSSPAACRTYNVLLGEGRRVALAAVPV